MKLSIFGVGYVGLVSGACFAELGNEVLCCDIDKKKIKNLNSGKIPIYEPGLEDVVERNIKAKRLIFTNYPEEAVKFGDILIIAVGTPPQDLGGADLKYVYNVAETIGKYLNSDNKVVVNKSTVPVGTAKEVEDIILKKLKERKEDFKFAVVSNPEFLKEGDAILDFMKPDRIVVGVNVEWAKKKMEELYSCFVKNGNPVYFMDTASSEMTKYAANTMLATKISFINQIADLCEIVGADVEEVRKGICSDKRIGPHFLYAGIGYGGSCFPKDVQALANLAKKNGYLAHLIESVELVNEAQKNVLSKKIIKELKDVNHKKIAVWGLSFKPNTDDMRSAPSINIIEKLISKGAKIFAYDPVAIEEAKHIFGSRIKYEKDMYDCLKGADALVIVTEWAQFKEPDFVKMKKLMKSKIIFDGRNIYSLEKIKDLGFRYISIGRKGV